MTQHLPQRRHVWIVFSLLALACMPQAMAERLEHDLTTLRALGDFALPLMDDLVGLPGEATWGEWLEALSKLASRALRDPTRVHAVFTELTPLGPVGPVICSNGAVVVDTATDDVLIAHPSPGAVSRFRLDRARNDAPGVPSAAGRKPNLQPDFNVRVCDRFDARLSAVLRELDESNRCVQKSDESTSI